MPGPGEGFDTVQIAESLFVSPANVWNKRMLTQNLH